MCYEKKSKYVLRIFSLEFVPFTERGLYLSFKLLHFPLNNTFCMLWIQANVLNPRQFCIFSHNNTTISSSLFDILIFISGREFSETPGSAKKIFWFNKQNPWETFLFKILFANPYWGYFSVGIFLWVYFLNLSRIIERLSLKWYPKFFEEL